MSNNNLHNEDRKIKNWTALLPVRVACFILIIALAFVTLNRFVSIDNRVGDTGLGVDIISRQMDAEFHFNNRHMHNAVHFANTALRFESEESIRAGNHLIWVVSHHPVAVDNEAPEVPVPSVTWFDIEDFNNHFQEPFLPEFSFEAHYDDDGNLVQTNVYDRHGVIVVVLLHGEFGNIIQAILHDIHGNFTEMHIIESGMRFPIHTHRGLVIFPADDPSVIFRTVTEETFEIDEINRGFDIEAQLKTPDGRRFYAHHVGDNSPHNREIAERNAINDQLVEFRWAMSFLEETVGLKYHISDMRGNVIANVAADLDWFLSQPIHLIMEDGDVIADSHNNTHDFDPFLDGHWVRGILDPDEILMDTGISIPLVRVAAGMDWRDLIQWSSGIVTERNASTIYLAFTNEAIGAYRAVFNSTRDAYIRDFAIAAGAVVLALGLFAVLMAGAGRRYAVSKAEGVHFSGNDKPFLDISLALVILWSVVWLFTSFSFLIEIMRQPVVVNILMAVLSAAVITPVLIWFMSFAKRLKAGKFWKHTLIYYLPSKLVAALKPVWQGFKLMPKVAVISAAAFFVILFVGIVGDVTRSGWTIFMFTFIVTAVVAFLLTRYALRLYTLEQAARKTGEGEYDEDIDVGGGELGSIANSINNISSVINAEVEQRMKSERLKTELITNVSHDIRTPLTSIITYTDLLKNEGLHSEKAPEYLDILTQKSQRLKTLTDELFEAAKATTGNIDVNIAELDIVSLINQVLGELDSTIKSSGLDLRVNLPESMHVKADGKLMWRVLENLLSNVFKYSLPNSRVYIDVLGDDMFVRVDLKNISNAELNIDPAELMDRFKRGDDSRADGGSGLGLSIVQSFVAAQGGKFEIAIDGDLFKASVSLPKADDK